MLAVRTTEAALRIATRENPGMFNIIDSLKCIASWRRMQTDERGATAVEYGMIVALIAAVIVGVVATLGGDVFDAFQAVVDGLNN